MRRRTDTSAPATNLTVFDGRRYRTSATWKAAFAEFLAARAAWSQERAGAQLPTIKVNGDEPFDWSRFRKSVPN
ncbi:hypothetical protein CH304_12840 [Rhodococcus sp. 15-649-1-2]|nr:hypothetical protein [Rhodococcus sp. 15-649-1-2]OZE81931.1 hypothetical protein CH304_12840 [Rhodococcus sp. 15-649-1-2]